MGEMAVTWVVSCDFWGLSDSNDAALSVVAARDANSSTRESTPSSVDPREGAIRRWCITARFGLSGQDPQPKWQIADCNAILTYFTSAGGQRCGLSSACARDKAGDYHVVSWCTGGSARATRASVASGILEEPCDDADWCAQGLCCGRCTASDRIPERIILDQLERV